jgi:hypothetical protein
MRPFFLLKRPVMSITPKSEAVDRFNFYIPITVHLKAKLPPTFGQFGGLRFLRINLSHNHPRHFRIKPADAVRAGDKIGRVENVAFNEIQYRAVDLRPLWLH